MKKIKYIAAGVLSAAVLSTGAIAFAAPTTPSLPPEQQVLLNDGYTKTIKNAGIFEKQAGACHMFIEVTGKTYMVMANSKSFLSAVSSVRPNHLIDMATLMEENCQG